MGHNGSPYEPAQLRDLRAELGRDPALVAEAEQSTVVDASAWPEAMAAEAYYGLAGDCVRKIQPHSEADPVALLIQFLIMFGSAVGRGPHFLAEADLHYPNLFGCFVGATAKGRKGTSYGRVRDLFAQIDREWVCSRIRSGLSSGEGLIDQVRDPAQKDEGVADKRLLIFEAEFALVLKVMQRDTNTLTAIIRQAWDTGHLRTMTKNSPLCATGAHVSIIGHITAVELRRYISETELASGFANRFLWLCVKRSKCLPDDEDRQIEPAALWPVLKSLAEALEFSQTVTVMSRDNEAREDWRHIYPALSAGKPGLLGAATSRAEAQVMRLATVYALLDRSASIRRPHLRAALAVWAYAEASAKFVFGAALGDPTADAILDLLRQSPLGVTRTEISHTLGRHKPQPEIERALRALIAIAAARFTPEPTAGRSSQRWFAV